MCAYTSASRLCGVYTLIYVAAVCRRILSRKIIGQIFLLLNKLAKLQFPIAVQNVRQKSLQQHPCINAHMHAGMYVCTCMPCFCFVLSFARSLTLGCLRVLIYNVDFGGADARFVS